MSTTKKITQDDRVWGALSYLWILSIFVLAMKKDDEYIRFHANQGALLFVASLVGIIPVLGWFLSIIICILMVLGIAKAYNGEKWELPIGANVAKDFGGWLVEKLKL
jgi:uncharacterized membrane protein